MHLPHTHSRRMVKYNIPRAPEPLGSTSSASTYTTATTMPNHGPKELSSTSKAVIVSVASCFGVAILIILGVYFYGRRRHNTKNPGTVLDKDAFTNAKKSASSPEFNKQLGADLMKLNSSVLSPVRPHHHRESSSTSTSNPTLGRQPQSNSPLRIANADANEKMSTPTLAFPKPVAEKGRPPRSKPAWLSPISTEDEVRSPPPAYAMWSASAGQEIFIPIPPQRSPQKSEATPMSKASTKSLAIPDHDVPVISPARSESFASKDLALPSLTPPAPSASGLDSAGSQIGSSRVEHDTDVKLPRLMRVVAPFTPNLPDELHVKVGDTVRIIEEYKDGWCFAQILGGKDAPKGVVPLVCLQEKKKLVPFTHRASDR